MKATNRQPGPLGTNIAPIPNMPLSIASSSRAGAPSDEERAYYSLSRRVYGSWFASAYDAITWPIRGLRSRVAGLAEIHRGTRAIDVATGTGAQAAAFSEAGASVVAIDLSPRMLSIARRKQRGRGIEFIEADATDLPVPDARFDVASVSFALHEMPRGVRARVVSEMARVTRPGGKVIVVDYTLPRSRVWSWLVFRVVKLYERDHYSEFVHADLHALLGRFGIAVRSEHRALFGIARIVIGVCEA